MEALGRSKASLSSKLAVAQEEVAHLKAELGDHTSQTAKLKAQLHSIHDAHSKVSCITKASPAGARAFVHLCGNCAIGVPCCHCICCFGACAECQADNHYSRNWACLHHTSI